MLPLSNIIGRPRKALSINGNELALGYLLGVFYGDGCIHGQSFRLSVKDLLFIKKVRHAFNEIGIDYQHVCKRDTGLYRLTVSHTNFVELMGSLNISFLNRWQMIEFVNGFFDSEGSVWLKHRNDGEGWMRGIAFYNTDRILLECIREFLKEYEISTTLSVYEKKGSVRRLGNCFIKSSCDCYRLVIPDKRSMHNFCKVFSSFGRKQKVLDKIYKEVSC